MKHVFGYNRYLKSKHWNGMRLLHARSGSKCKMCGEVKTVQLHHITYDNVGNETTKDLILLCHTCHEMAHQCGGGDKISKYLLTDDDTSKNKIKLPEASANPTKFKKSKGLNKRKRKIKSKQSKSTANIKKTL